MFLAKEAADLLLAQSCNWLDRWILLSFETTSTRLIEPRADTKDNYELVTCEVMGHRGSGTTAPTFVTRREWHVKMRVTFAYLIFGSILPQPFALRMGIVEGTEVEPVLCWRFFSTNTLFSDGGD